MTIPNANPRTATLFAVLLKAKDIATNRQTAAALDMPAPDRLPNAEIFSACVTVEELGYLRESAAVFGGITDDDLAAAMLAGCREAVLLKQNKPPTN